LGRFLRVVPWVLIGVRVALGPMIYLLAHRVAGAPMVLVLCLGLFSDIFDGVIARRLSVVTDRLRTADSYADGWYFGWVAAAAWTAAPGPIRAMERPIAVVVIAAASNDAVDLLRYGRLTSFHAYSAKIWGITLFLAAAALLGYHTGVPLLWLAVIAGLITNAEGFAMKLLLPEWEHDVPSLWHVVRRRKHASRFG